MAKPNGKKLDFNKHGVPVYERDPAMLDEYEERCWDLYYGRAGQDALQRATPIHLRQGARGIVYEAVKSLKHDDLLASGEAGEEADWTAGLTLYLKTVRESPQTEASVEESVLFDQVFYENTVWRQQGEAVSAYLIRRRDEFKKLNDTLATEGGCNIPEKVQAHLLLKFAGLSQTQRTGILASCGNKVDLAQYQTALRMQYAKVHEHDKNDQRTRRETVTPKRWKPRSGYVANYEVEPEEEEENEDEPYETLSVEPGDQTDIEDTEQFDPQDLATEIFQLDLEDLDTDQFEALTTIAQVRQKGKGKGKGRGKGKNKGRQGTSARPPERDRRCPSRRRARSPWRSEKSERLA